MKPSPDGTVRALQSCAYRPEDSIRCKWHFQMADAMDAESIDDGVDQHRGRRCRTRFTSAFDAERIARGGVLLIYFD